MTDPAPADPTTAEVLEIEARLHDAAGAVPLPPSSVQDELRRGRRRLRRRRAAGAIAALAAVAVVAAGATLVAGTDGRDGSAPAATSPSDRATDPTTPTAGPTGSAAPTASPTRDTRTDQEILQAYRDVVAENVDPTGTHLQAVPDNVQSSGPGRGTKLAWSNPGEEGLGVIEVFVSAGWASQWYLTCDPFQDCVDLRVGRIDARVLREDGATYVGVARDDGSVAVVSASALFGNNSTVPVSGMDVSEADLARAAADPRLTLPAPPQDRRGGGRGGAPGD